MDSQVKTIDNRGGKRVKACPGCGREFAAGGWQGQRAYEAHVRQCPSLNFQVHHYDFNPLDKEVDVGDVCVFFGRMDQIGHVQIIVEQPSKVDPQYVEDMGLSHPGRDVWSLSTIHSTGLRRGGVCEEKVFVSVKANGELILVGCVEVDALKQPLEAKQCDDLQFDIYQAPGPLRACFQRQLADRATQLTMTRHEWSLITGARAALGVFTSRGRKLQSIPTVEEWKQSLEIEPICTTIFIGWWQRYLHLLGNEAEQIEDPTAFGLLPDGEQDIAMHPLGMVLIYKYMPISPCILPKYLLKDLHDGDGEWCKLQRMTRNRQVAPMTMARKTLLVKLLSSREMVLQVLALQKLTQCCIDEGALPWLKELAPILEHLATGTAFESSVREMSARVLMKCKAWDHSESHVRDIYLLLKQKHPVGRKRQIEELEGIANDLQRKVQRLVESEGELFSNI
jgi:hypothetical protein